MAVESEPVAVEEAAALDSSEDPDEEVGLAEAEPEVEEEPAVAEAEEEEEDTSLQERSNNGVVLKVEPTIPKWGETATEVSSSWRVYQKVLTLPKRGHPTWSQ